MGLLEDAESRAGLEEHLARRCPQCLQGVRDANDSFSLVGLLAPLLDPPAELRDRVLAAVRGAKAPVAVMPSKQPVWKPALPWAVAACLLMGVLYYRQGEQQALDQLVTVRVRLQQMENARELDMAELARLRPLRDFLEQPETKVVTFGEPATQPPRGRVLVNRSRGVLLMASRLPGLAPDRTFQMWIIPKAGGGGPKPAGLFQAEGGVAVHLQTGPFDLADATAVAVSVEPHSGSAAPTTTPILVAALGAL
jgi:hypothetical protein